MRSQAELWRSPAQGIFPAEWSLLGLHIKKFQTYSINIRNIPAIKM